MLIISGFCEGCLQKWLSQTEVVVGKRPGTTESESAELRELGKRNRLLERENETLRPQRPTCPRRTCREMAPPAGERSVRRLQFPPR